MTLPKKFSEEQLLKKIRNVDVSDIYDIKKISDKVLYVLKIIKLDLKLEDFIPISTLTTIFVDVLAISVTPRMIINSLNPIKSKIHRKEADSEISCKIMHEGISHISKIVGKTQKSITTKKANPEKRIGTSIQTITQMALHKDLKPGLFYIVLVDLAHSTEASTRLIPSEHKKRIKQFIEFTRNSLPKNPQNFSIFIRDNGDGALFLFSNFEDILKWARKIDELCDEYNKQCIDEQKPDVYHMYSKKIVHLGEVQFENGYNPISLAVNQIFKIEKEFGRINLGTTDTVFQVIVPRIKSGQLSHKEIKRVLLQGEKEPRPIWEIGY